MGISKVAMISFWRNDAERRIPDRVAHLLSKTHPCLRWIWIVGDSDDRTFEALRNIRASNYGGKEVDIFQYDTGISGEGPKSRRRRMSLSANAAFDRLGPDDEFVVWHESEMMSPPDIVERLIGTGKCPVAGWPILRTANGLMFYDTRSFVAKGLRFSNLPPYHECYRPDRPFAVDSVGSCWMFHAADIRAGARCYEDACVELCARFKELGREIWVDPSIPVINPADLWMSDEHGESDPGGKGGPNCQATMCSGGRIGSSLSPWLLRMHRANVFVETGTQWSGGILTALCTGFYRDIYSIEADASCYDAAKKLFKGNPSVHLVLGDSASTIGEVLERVDERALIWLDAHSFNDPNPVFDELEAVSRHPVRNHALMIDDRRMWGGRELCWRDVTEDRVVAAVKRINPAYEISWADSWNAPEDILVADIPGEPR